MTAMLETVITRPSLEDVFFFEYNLDFGIPDIDHFNMHVKSAGSGFISTEIDNYITWEEIESRKSELRPDLVEMLKYKLPLELVSDIDFNLIFCVGTKGEPPFNPFSLTYTFRHFYQTYDQLIAGYNHGDFKKVIIDWEPFILQTNNTGTERCFVDNNEVEFRGAFAEIAEKQKAP